MLYISSIVISTLFAGLSAAAPAATSTAASCSASLISPVPHGKHCASNGSLTNPDPTGAPFTGSLLLCADTCLGSSTCQSLSFNSTSSSCQLYGKSLTAQDFNTKHADDEVEYYAAGCFACSSVTTTHATTASSTSTTSTHLSTSTTTKATTTISSTAATSTYPICLETSVTEGAPNGTHVTYTKYYIGSGYTHKSTSSASYPAVLTNFYGQVPANYPCSAITSCATIAAIQNGIYDSFDLYLISVPGSSSPVWECVALKSGDVDVGDWSIGDSSIIAAYGFAVGA